MIEAEGMWQYWQGGCSCCTFETRWQQLEGRREIFGSFECTFHLAQSFGRLAGNGCMQGSDEYPWTAEMVQPHNKVWGLQDLEARRGYLVEFSCSRKRVCDKREARRCEVVKALGAWCAFSVFSLYLGVLSVCLDYSFLVLCEAITLGGSHTGGQFMTCPCAAAQSRMS